MQMYKGFMQLYIPNNIAPKQLIERGFIPVESIQLDGKDLIIKYSWGKPTARCKLRVKDVNDADTVKAIEELLNVSLRQTVS